ncbi:hypothetical protein BB558_006072 [Smittium angustum]|uniref:Uncharacterized protein n=1 Tax=Smittium angustum TaxID=133377 RepID=A0A2U1IYR0_SMIAN|nr:hypothetical protein BB558_006072 [Smittium angustum]
MDMTYVPQQDNWKLNKMLALSLELKTSLMSADLIDPITRSKLWINYNVNKVIDISNLLNSLPNNNLPIQRDNNLVISNMALFARGKLEGYTSKSGIDYLLNSNYLSPNLKA